MFLKDTQVSSFWVLRFRDLGAPFTSFGCFIFEIWVLHASVFVFECFVFETTIPNMQKIVNARAAARAIYCKRVTKSYLC